MKGQEVSKPWKKVVFGKIGRQTFFRNRHPETRDLLISMTKRCQNHNFHAICRPNPWETQKQQMIMKNPKFTKNRRVQQTLCHCMYSSTARPPRHSKTQKGPQPQKGKENQVFQLPYLNDMSYMHNPPKTSAFPTSMHSILSLRDRRPERRDFLFRMTKRC